MKSSLISTNFYLYRMQHIRNKDYDDICAFESEGKIFFGKDIMNPTNLPR